MEQVFEELKSRIAELEAKVAALPSPQEFASIKSDLELLKSDAAPRATSTAEAALKVAYGLKDEVAQSVDSIDQLREEVTTLKRSEAVAQPGLQLVPRVRENIIKYLESTEVDMFSPKVIIWMSSNCPYARLGIMGRSLGVYRPHFAVVEIWLKEPVQANGLTFFSAMDLFPMKAQIVLGGQPYECAHQVNIEEPKKKKDRTDSIRSDFSARMVSWIRIEQQDVSRKGSGCLVYNLELHSPDPEYASGVFKTLRQKNPNMRYACKVFVHRVPPVDGFMQHRAIWATPKTKIGTLREKQPWVEVEIVEGRLKATGYTLMANSEHTKSWTLYGTNDRRVPVDKWTILHRYDGGVSGFRFICNQKTTFPCISSEPMKYFRMIADPAPSGNITYISLCKFDIHGVLCP